MKINELKIYSKRLKDQVKFYTTILGVECIYQSEEKASFQIGNSVLTIASKPDATPYHFAINIPSNKEDEALSWLKDRVSILRDNETELHDFDFWNAKAMYFYDSDKNIVEFIARKNLKNEQKEPFGVDQLLCISEIGMPTLDIKSKFEQLHALTGIEKYSGGYDRMLAIGDESGLFICINKEAKDWFPTGDRAHSSHFELNFDQNGKSYRIKFEEDKLVEIS